jgi:hypothetical protein
MGEKRVLTIDRSKWRRGGGSEINHPDGPTRLLNERGKMCCLGFDALACGLPPEAIQDKGEPGEIDDALRNFPEYVKSARFHDDDEGPYQTWRIDDAIRDNDDATLTEARREELVRKDLLALGWDDVVFVDSVEA